MLLKNAGATGSVRKYTKQVWFGLLFLLTVGTGLVLWSQNNYELMYADDHPLLVEYAKTKGDRKQGLSYRKQLSNGHGMLFFLKGSGTSCMWMKDMNFPLDVYWYSSEGTLISYNEGLRPDTYPQIFCPDVSAEYMLEVNAGEFQTPPQKIQLF